MLHYVLLEAVTFSAWGCGEANTPGVADKGVEGLWVAQQEVVALIKYEDVVGSLLEREAYMIHDPGAEVVELPVPILNKW